MRISLKKCLLNKNILKLTFCCPILSKSNKLYKSTPFMKHYRIWALESTSSSSKWFSLGKKLWKSLFSGSLYERCVGTDFHAKLETARSRKKFLLIRYWGIYLVELVLSSLVQLWTRSSQQRNISSHQWIKFLYIFQIFFCFDQVLLVWLFCYSE